MSWTWINKANIYIFAWAIYSSQAIFLPKGSVLTQLLLLALLAVSFYYVFAANTCYKLPVYFKGLNILLVMFFIYGMYLILGGYDPTDYAKPVRSFVYLQGILISLLPIYPLYVFSKEGLISEKSLQVWFVFLFVLTVANYYEKQSELLRAAMHKMVKREEFTNNVGYDFLSLIPFCVFFYKKPIMQYIALGACMVFLLFAMKRGAILIGGICVFWLLWNNIKNVTLGKKVVMVVLTVLLGYIVFLFVEDMLQESLYFQKRLNDTMEGRTSKRDVLYAFFANHFWNETTPIQFLFGGGANTTLKIFYNYAHNDWLEIAINQGLFGIIVYLLYWFSFLKNTLSKVFSPSTKLALQLVFVTTFFQTIFSMSYGSLGYLVMLILGFCLAQEKNDAQVGDGSKIIEKKQKRIFGRTYKKVKLPLPR